MQTVDAVKDFYGKDLTSTRDLKTGACTAQSSASNKLICGILGQVHEEVKAKYYGCGPVFPAGVKGIKVLDLGSGSGQDCFIFSKLVGPDGQIVGVEMTDGQLDVANKYIDYHTQLYGYNKPNVKFVKGYMESLQEAGFNNNTIDLAISNGAINLTKDKLTIFKEAYKVLKEGGELHFSDIYVDRVLPPSVKENKELWCECIVGALYWRDICNYAKESGFSTPRLISAGLSSIDDKNFQKILGDAQFASVTYSMFKLPAQSQPTSTVVYNGQIEGYEDGFNLDYGITFKKGEVCHVKPEVATILSSSRYRQYFTITEGENGPLKDSNLEKDPFDYCAEKCTKKTCG